MKERTETIRATRLFWPLALGLGLALALLWVVMPGANAEAQPLTPGFPAAQAAGQRAPQSADVAQAVNPGFTLDLAYDTIWGVVDPGDWVTVTRTTGGAAYGAAEADGVGFFWTPLWQSIGQPVNVVAGDTVAIYVNGAISATITPYTITGYVDVLNDWVVGTISGASNMPVTVTLGMWADSNLSGMPQVATTSDGSGTFTATFATNDLGPNTYARVEYATGSNTVQLYLYPQAVFHVDTQPSTGDPYTRTFSSVFGYAVPGQTITVTLVRGGIPLTPTTGKANKIHGDYRVDLMIEIDDVLEVDLGSGTVVTTVARAITAYPDATLDRVTGICSPNETVRVWSRDGRLGSYDEVITTADASGNYTATFASYDLQASDGVNIATTDAEGDEVVLRSGPPNIGVGPSWDVAWATVDGPNLPVTITLDTGMSVFSVTTESNLGNNVSGVRFGSPAEDIQAGHIITVESPSWTGVMTVASLSYNFDTTGDRVLGQFDISASRMVVQVQQWQQDQYPIHGYMNVSVAASSPFTATFPGYDVRDSGSVLVFHHDANDYPTLLAQEAQWFEVNAPNGVSARPGTPGATVTATLYQSDGTTFKRQASQDTPEWWGGYWLDLQGDIAVGDWITVTDGVGWTAGIQVPTLTIEADEDTDLVWGEGPKVLLFAEYGDWPNWAGRFVPVDGYALDWSFFGRDVRYGDNLGAIYQAPSGNRVRQQYQWPQMRVNYGHDWVGGDYPAGHTFWVTVTDGVASTAVVSTTPSGGWGGDGFETGDSEWLTVRPDIQPGDQVTFRSDDGYSNVISVGTITGNLDIDGDVISGTILAPFGSQTVTVECHIWEPGSPNPIQVDGVAADGGSYTCDFSGDWDILPGHSVAVMYIEPDDGDRVINVFREPVPNLRVNKSSQGQPAPGGNFVYEVEYQNHGEGDAVNVVLTDTLPLSTTYVSDSSGVPTHVNGRVITWSLPSIPAQSENYRFDLVVAVDPLASGNLHNEVEIYAPYDDDPGNNSASTDDTVQSSDVDLSVEKWGHHSWPAPGYDFVYVIQYRNDGSTGSGIVTLADTLPLSTTYVSWFSRDPLWNLVAVGSQVVFTRPVIAGGGDSNELYLTLHLSDTVQEGDTLTNVVSIVTTNETGGTDDNVYTHTMEAQGPYLDIGVSKDFGHGTTVAGYDVTYYVNYMNHSNTPAYGVLITDTLPSGATFVTSTIEVWQYGNWQRVPFPPDSVTLDRVVWDLDTLDVAEDGDSGEYGQIHVTLHISSGVSAGTVLTNAVEIASTGASPESDDNPENDSDEAAITVRNTGPNLMVLKRGDWQGGPPWQIEYDLQFYNVGTTRIESFAISDTYPLSTTLDWGDVWFGWPITFTDNYTDNQAIWEVGNPINAGESGGGRLVVNVDPNVERGRLLTNVIEIAGAQTEVETADNTYTLVKTTGPDLYVVKTAPSSWVEAGETLTFTLRYGNQAERWIDGTDESGTVYITDTLPAGMEYVTSTMRWCGGPDCPYVTPNIVGDDLAFDVGWQGDGWWNEIYLTVQVTDTALGGDTFSNQVEIGSSNPVSDVEPYESNNRDTEALTLYDPLFEISKTYESNRVAGKVVTYTLTVTNVGSETATGVVVSDTIPTALTEVATDSGTLELPFVWWKLGPIAPNGGTDTGQFHATLPCTASLSIDNDDYSVRSSDQGVSGPAGVPVSFFVVEPTISVGITHTLGTIVVSDTVAFTATAGTDGTGLSYEWDLGDGPMSGGLTTTHVYTQDGDFTVVFTATDTCGYSEAATVTVAVNPPNLVANFDHSPDPANTLVNGTVTFTDTSTTDVPPIVAWMWDFGDDSASAFAQDASHVYDTVGTYTVTLVVTDALGYSDNEVKTNVVTVSLACTPVTSVTFAYAPLYPTIQSPVVFTATVTPSGATQPITYTWDFGDGVTSTTTIASTSHTYTTSGTMTVDVTAYNPCTPAGVSSAPADIEVASLRVFLPLVLRNY